jgi:hypothetical protein
MVHPGILVIACLYLLAPQLPSPARSVASPAIKAKDEKLRKDVEPVVRELNKDLEQRLKTLENLAQPSAKDSPTAQTGRAPDFQLTVSRGIPERGFLEKYSPILFPSIISVLTLFLTFRQQAKLQKMSQENQQQLQGLAQKNQQEVQGLAQKHQESLQQLSAENTQRLQREARWGTRQLEAAQDVWGFLEQTTATYRLDNPVTVLTDSIQVTAPPTLLQSQKEIGNLIKKQGFFLPKGSGTILVRILEQLRAGSGSLGTLKASLEEIRQGLKVEFDVQI